MPHAPAVAERVFQFSKNFTNLKNFLIRGLIFLPLYIFLSTVANAQQDDPLQGYWFRYYNQFSLTPKWVLHTELDERRLLNPDRQAQFFIHTHLHYLLSPKLDFGAGFNHNLSKSRTNVTIPEWRPWQEVNFNATPTSKVKLSFRYRLDERFIHHSSATQLEDGYQFVLRHRMRVQVMHRIGKNEHIIPFATDGELYYPLGYSSNHASGNALVTIQRLPAPTTGERGIGSTIKIVLQKLAGEKLSFPYNYPSLCSATADVSGKISYNNNTIQMATAAQNAAKIL